MMRPYGKVGCVTEEVLFQLDELDGRRAIGQGASAVVYVGSWRGLDVAVKVFRGGLAQRAEDEAERERAVHRRLRHPNIVGMLGEAATECSYALVFEYCPRALDVVALGGWRPGALGARLQILDIALAVARALEHAHLRGVMHRDVKPSQILLSGCGFAGGATAATAKLADWGLACRVGTQECCIGETGTWEYMAPEVITCGTGTYAPCGTTRGTPRGSPHGTPRGTPNGSPHGTLDGSHTPGGGTGSGEGKYKLAQKQSHQHQLGHAHTHTQAQAYGTAADVYSYGVTLWCILAGEAYPYASEYITAEQAAVLVARGTLRPRPLRRLHDAPELHALLTVCWAQHPADRPTMTQVVDELLHIRAEVEMRCSEPPTPVQSWWSPWFW